MPGWWAANDPDPLLPTPGGHANFGTAHGAAGILAFLSLATLDGRIVEGQRTAISYLQTWFDRWRQESGEGPWWPQWLTRHHLRSGRPGQPRPGRPSWCYGAAGIARALQLSALATGDRHRQQEAENTIAACLTGSQLDRVTSASLCHGTAGLYQTARRAANDALTATISDRLPGLAAKLTAFSTRPRHPGFLTGDTGRRLALETIRAAGPPRSGWDACLLIT